MVCRRHEATPPASGLAAVVVRGPAIGGGGAGRRAEEDCLAKSLLEVGGAGNAASFSSRGPVASLSPQLKVMIHLRQALGGVVGTFFFFLVFCFCF